MKEWPKLDLTNEDCMNLLARTPDKFYDLAIVDPPYGIGEDGSKNKTRGKKAKAKDYKSFAGGDKEPPSQEYFNELRRCSKNQIIWGGNYFDLGKTKGWIIWKKMDIKTDFNPIEMAWTSNMKMGYFDFLWAGMWQEDMKNKETRIHPTQKPIALYKWLLSNYAKPGDKILDTHLGSGSIAIACLDMGFELTGCELDSEYFGKMTKRIDAFKSQPKLF